MPTYLDEKAEREEKRREREAWERQHRGFDNSAEEPPRPFYENPDEEEGEEREEEEERQEGRGEGRREKAKQALEEQRKEELNRKMAEKRARERAAARTGPEGGAARAGEKAGEAAVRGGAQVGRAAVGAAGTEAAAAGTAGAGAAAGGTVAAGAGGAAAGGGAAAAGVSVGVVVLVIILILLLFVVILALFLGTCNQPGIAGSFTRAVSRVGSWIGVIPEDICKYLKPPGGAPGTAQGTGVMMNGFMNAASPELANFQACLQPRLAAAGITYNLTSITDGNIALGLCSPLDPAEIFNNASNCQHAQYSCHYGGTSPTCQQSGSYALDYVLTSGMGAAAQNQFQTAALACNAGAYVLYETDHMHVSIGNAFGCGCN